MARKKKEKKGEGEGKGGVRGGTKGGRGRKKEKKKKKLTSANHRARLLRNLGLSKKFGVVLSIGTTRTTGGPQAGNNSLCFVCFVVWGGGRKGVRKGYR